MQHIHDHIRAISGTLFSGIGFGVAAAPASGIDDLYRLAGLLVGFGGVCATAWSVYEARQRRLDERDRDRCRRGRDQRR